MDKVKGFISESDFVEYVKGLYHGTRPFRACDRSTARSSLAEIEERIAAGDNRRELIEQYTNSGTPDPRDR